MNTSIPDHPDFPQQEDLIYLNHAAVAPWPERTRQAVHAFADANCHVGARDYPQWLKVEQRLRDRLAWLIGGVNRDEIALLKNTSEGLSVIAQGLRWQPGDQIIISDQEFPSNRIPWQALADQGVEVIEVCLDNDDPEQAVIDAMGERTRLVSLSAVQYGTGLLMNMARIGKACRDRDILFCVDAIQILGALPFDAEAACADFVVADGHKWMLGPEGLALFYCRHELQSRLILRQHGWHMIANAGDYSQTDWQVADNAKRFECGSPNMLGAHALDASLSLLQDTGMEAVEAALQERIQYLIDGLLRHGATLLSPVDEEKRAGIVTFVLPDEAPSDTFQRLKRQGVVCAERGGGIRFSPHFYTAYSVIDRALALL
ncbi:aminotransferase class V-fold PLP-dependent enzyme [Alcanivorax sp. S6407]|uniref:aminotransferase class V-fold PLP-dependent enzyme n=1 Tax=Alcanivorax sp. S6407 TaxID=2926424 RepID=UPI001FF6E0E0|nr:aminotransferase class V-fold PLP-dependent enzyme [Alcanivorax sp. S6407]MCK0155406.1 aminotransferase class V-fold PLP-dependent enzyme [Alcanivorax sp. S6407]